MSAPKANLEAFPRSVTLVLVLGLVALAAFPFVGSEFHAANGHAHDDLWRSSP